MPSEVQAYPRFSFGKTVTDMFGVIGRNFLLLCGLALLLYGVPSALFTIFLFENMTSLFADAATAEAMPSAFDAFGAFGTSFIVSTVGSIFISIFTQGAMIWAVLQDLDGKTPGFGGALNAGLRFFLVIFGITLIVYIALGAVIALPAMLVFGIGAIGTAAILFLIVIIPLILFLMVIVLVAVPAAIAEGIGPIGAVLRSIELTKGHRWKLFAMIIIYFFAATIISSAISGATMPFMMMGDIDPGSPFDGLTPIMAIQAFLGSLTLVIAYPAIAATYHNLRIAKEGLKQEDVADIFE
ncbi:hypothetical protein [Parasphingopyxis sp.]|uniref:hypothetical protein n=1 Tax=Parasphingopyxis sp. TaxID=1920299 RepID=UPI00260A9C6F|nr:hypothetical protein [Parasphingopyxis sp.]